MSFIFLFIFCQAKLADVTGQRTDRLYCPETGYTGQRTVQVILYVLQFKCLLNLYLFVWLVGWLIGCLMIRTSCSFFYFACNIFFPYFCPGNEGLFLPYAFHTCIGESFSFLVCLTYMKLIWNKCKTN